MDTATTLITPDRIDMAGRTLDGCCVPYHELTHLVVNPNGAVIMPGAFASAATDLRTVFLFRAHDHREAIGHAVGLTEQPDGLYGSFVLRDGPVGDAALADLRAGYLPALSIGFTATRTRRGPLGVEPRSSRPSCGSVGASARAYDGPGCSPCAALGATSGQQWPFHDGPTSTSRRCPSRARALPRWQESTSLAGVNPTARRHGGRAGLAVI